MHPAPKDYSVVFMVGTSPQEQVPSGSSEVDAADQEPLALIRINPKEPSALSRMNPEEPLALRRINHEEPLALNRINEEPLALRRLDQEPWALSLLVALGRTIARTL